MECKGIASYRFRGDVRSSRIVQVQMGFLPAGDAAAVGASEFARDSRKVTEDVGRDL
jgi:hypothetical protein